MKLHHASIPLIIASFLILRAPSARAYHLLINGEQAMQLYYSLTGPAVQHEGAAGHLYNKGLNVLCRYTEADTIRKGHPVALTDPSRYACSMKFNPNGVAFPEPTPGR